MDISLGKLRELVMDSEVGHAAVHGVAKSWTQLRDWTELKWKSLSLLCLLCHLALKQPSEIHIWMAMNVFQLNTWGPTWGCHLLSSISWVAQSCPTLCDPMDGSMPGFPVHHQLLEFAQTHVHWVGDAIQPSHPLSSTSPPTFNLSQHQGLFKWVSSLHQVAKVLEFQLQHKSFQWIFRTDFL